MNDRFSADARDEAQHLSLLIRSRIQKAAPMKIHEIAAALLLLAGIAVAGLVANASASLRTSDRAAIVSVIDAYAIAGAGAEASIFVNYE